MKKIFFLFFFTFSLSNASAQVDRRIGTGQYGNGSQTKKVDLVETSVENLKEKLNLDGFQEAIVRNLIKDNQAKSKEIIEKSDLILFVLDASRELEKDDHQIISLIKENNKKAIIHYDYLYIEK